MTVADGTVDPNTRLDVTFSRVALVTGVLAAGVALGARLLA